jgi:DNA repair protein RecO (recombination protein O)
VSLESASGVVLRVRLLTETSLIVHWLTAGHGRLAVVAKGARRPKSPFRGRLDLFYAGEFTFQRSRRSDLHNLRELRLTETHPALRTDLARLRQAAYAALLIELATESETPVPQVFDLFLELLSALEAGPATPELLLAFELKLLTASGLQPDFTASALDAGARQIAHALATFPLADCGRVRSSLVQAGALQRFLHGFLIYHFERVPRGRAEALALTRERPAPDSDPRRE